MSIAMLFFLSASPSFVAAFSERVASISDPTKATILIPPFLLARF